MGYSVKGAVVSIPVRRLPDSAIGGGSSSMPLSSSTRGAATPPTLSPLPFVLGVLDPVKEQATHMTRLNRGKFLGLNRRVHTSQFAIQWPRADTHAVPPWVPSIETVAERQAVRAQPKEAPKEEQGPGRYRLVIGVCEC